MAIQQLKGAAYMPDNVVVNSAKGKLLPEMFAMVQNYLWPIIVGAFIIGGIYFQFRGSIKYSEKVREEIPLVNNRVTILETKFDEHCTAQKEQYAEIRADVKELLRRVK